MLLRYWVCHGALIRINMMYWCIGMMAATHSGLSESFPLQVSGVWIHMCMYTTVNSDNILTKSRLMIVTAIMQPLSELFTCSNVPNALAKLP